MYVCAAELWLLSILTHTQRERSKASDRRWATAIFFMRLFRFSLNRTRKSLEMVEGSSTANKREEEIEKRQEKSGEGRGKNCRAFNLKICQKTIGCRLLLVVGCVGSAALRAWPRPIHRHHRHRLSSSSSSSRSYQSQFQSQSQSHSQSQSQLESLSFLQCLAKREYY